jgi:hypothetical protein
MDAKDETPNFLAGATVYQAAGHGILPYIQEVDKKL